MKKTLLALVMAGIFAPIVLAGDSICAMKTVTKGFHCETDSKILDAKDLVSNKKYHYCTECEVVADEAGDCEGCEKPVVVKTTGKDVCGECFEKPEAVELCNRKYFACPGCDEKSSDVRECDTCEKKLTEKVDRALIEYECSECYATANKAGKCTDAECENKGKALTKTCSESGTFPHD